MMEMPWQFKRLYVEVRFNCVEPHQGNVRMNRADGDLRQHRKDSAEPHLGIVRAVRAEERAHREHRQDRPHPDITCAELPKNWSAREDYFLQIMLRMKLKGITYFQKLTVFVKILIFLNKSWYLLFTSLLLKIGSRVSVNKNISLNTLSFLKC